MVKILHMKNGYKIDVIIALKTIPLAPKATILELILNIPNKKLFSKPI